jgi:hypothetical protein
MELATGAILRGIAVLHIVPQTRDDHHGRDLLEGWLQWARMRDSRVDTGPPRLDDRGLAAVLDGAAGQTCDAQFGSSCQSTAPDPANCNNKAEYRTAWSVDSTESHSIAPHKQSGTYHRMFIFRPENCLCSALEIQHYQVGMQHQPIKILYRE